MKTSGLSPSERYRRYALLAQGFWWPSEGLLAALDEAGQGLSLPASETLSLEALQRDYDRLFTHRTQVVCPIYQVEYEPQRMVAQGVILADVAGFYRAFGLELSVSERPDHLALELEFMKVLIYKEALARHAKQMERVGFCREAQRKFLEAHLGRWVPLFCQLLSRQAGFYAALGRCLQDFIAAECRALEARVEEIKTWTSLPEPSSMDCPATVTGGNRY